MSQIQFKCEKCGLSFYGVTVFQLHLAKCCQQDQLTEPVADVTEHEISNNSSTTKKSKNNDEIISTDNNNQQF